jgi:hypothetical protein
MLTPAPARHVAHHRVAGHRLAALGVAHHEPVGALDAHALAVPAHAVDEPLERVRRLRLLGRVELG